MSWRERILADLNESLREIGSLEAAEKLLSWDQETRMPSGADKARAEIISNMAKVRHEMSVSPLFEERVMKAKYLLSTGELSLEETCIVRETVRDLESEKKLPTKLVAESAKTASENQSAWQEARRLSDFNMFLPNLKKAFDLARQRAECLGYEKSPYDALLGEYSLGMTSEEVSRTFGIVRDFLVSFVARIRDSKVNLRRDFLYRSCPIPAQYKFAKNVIRKLGFKLAHGRIDRSAHPMSESLDPTDVFVSTRYRRHDFLNQCLGSIIHEVGHGITSQGHLPEYFGTPMGEFSQDMMDAHESQSRLYENAVGKSIPFWIYFFPRLQRAFPGVFDDVNLHEFYRAINYVEPSLVRVDADEVTYNLHVILRFEIESAIINGNLEVDGDLPSVWNRSIKNSLGLDVPNDRLGILQDVHWPELLIGYFPSYTLGNTYMPQIYTAAKSAIPGLEDGFTHGEFLPLRDWLNQNIHRYGRMYAPKVLVERACGEPPDPKYFIDYINSKYSEIYNL